MHTTPSECARHVRAELETIISSLRFGELTELLELGRKLVERVDVDAGIRLSAVSAARTGCQT